MNILKNLKKTSIVLIASLSILISCTVIDPSHPIVMAKLSSITNIADDDTLMLSGTSFVNTAQVGETTYLFVVGQSDNGLSVFSVDDQGKLINVTNVNDDETLELDGAKSATTTEVGDTNYLFVAGYQDDGVSVFSVGDDGSLVNVDNVKDDENLSLKAAYSVATAQVGGTTYLFVAGYQDDGVSVFSVGNNGSLVNVDNVKDKDDETLKLDGVYSVTTAQVGTNIYLFVTGEEDGVSVFSVDDEGSLSNVYNINDEDNLNLEDTKSITTAEVGGNIYLFTQEFGNDNGVSVFSVANNGSLSNVTNVNNDENIALDGTTSITTAQIGMHTYLFATASHDDGVSMFLIGDDASLTSVANIYNDDTPLNIKGAFSVAATTVKENTYLFVTGNNNEGLSIFSIN